MVGRHALALPDGRTLDVHDAGGAPDAPVVLWHAGSPHTGALPAPLLALAAERGLRLVGAARPGYGGSSLLPGRRVGDAADDAARVLDHLGVHDRVATLGYSGGGPAALACAARLRDRIAAVGLVASPAPPSGDEGWFAGMHDPGDLRAGARGRAARLARAAQGAFDPAQFVDADWAVLAEGARWEAVGDDAQAAGAAGPDGLVDDDVALTAPWGFSLGDVQVPVVLAHGDADRVIPLHHAEALVSGLPDAHLDVLPGAGHVAVLDGIPALLDELTARLA